MADLESIVRALNKKFKKDIIVKGTEAKKRAFIPFSSPFANYMTRGGIAIGKATEFAGGPGSGKTTTAIDIMYNFQLMFHDRLIVYLDAENTFDDDYARLFGVDMSKVIMIKPEYEHAELLLEMTLECLRTGEVGLLIIDSIPFLRSKQEMEGTMEDKTYAGISQTLTTYCGKVIPLMNKFETTLIGINQIRAKIGVPYTAYNYPGGNMWQHSCSQRIFFRKGDLLDETYGTHPQSWEGVPVGHIVEMKYLKNKITRPDRLSGHFTLKYGEGIDVEYDMMQLAIALGVVEQSHSWLQWNGISKQGVFRLINAIKDEGKYEQFKDEIMEIALA